ncbi:MAG: hypothetical protein M1817_006759 [Caeruleum heppii]|nr:MAG: hypothetical protein M1817_006759 [Caeruleum heppii]
MEFEVSYSLDDEQQFWDELDDIVSQRCETHELIDNALRSYLQFTSNFRDDYLQTDDDIARCSYKLLTSSLCTAHKEYVRRQILYGLLQEDSPKTLHLIASFLLFDGRDDEVTFEMMNGEGAFPRLLELIRRPRREGDVEEDDGRLHRRLLELLYEMSRIQRVSSEELKILDDEFITYLFQIIEELSDDVNDPYHYPVIRVLLVLNEQYMVSAHDPGSNHEISHPPLTNRVMKLLSHRGSSFKTFGENIILLLNRESETSLQLLILKLLYLLFTTPQTYEYFYTNDLRVLLDVMLRNLLDLDPEDYHSPTTPTSPSGSSNTRALRHTYLRVLYPLLAHTQLRSPPYYKRDEVRRTMDALIRGGGVAHGHFEAVDETTRRLVCRCGRVEWVRGDDWDFCSASGEPNDELISPDGVATTTTDTSHHASEDSSSSVAAKRALGVGIGLNPEAGGSCASVDQVARLMERPGIMARTRGRDRLPTVSGETSAEEGVKLPDGEVDDRPGDAVVAAADPTESTTAKSKIKPKPPPPRRGLGMLAGRA